MAQALHSVWPRASETMQPQLKGLLQCIRTHEERLFIHVRNTATKRYGESVR